MSLSGYEKKLGNVHTPSSLRDRSLATRLPDPTAQFDRFSHSAYRYQVGGEAVMHFVLLSCIVYGMEADSAFRGTACIVVPRASLYCTRNP